MAERTPSSTAGAPPVTSLRGSLGVGSIVFMVVAAAAPLTVVAGTVPLGIAIGDGAAFPATFVMSAVVLLLFAVGFCAMTPHVPNAGAFYAYVEHGLGRVTGMGTAFLALATYTAVQLAVYGYIGAVVDGLVQNWGGPALPWWLWSFVVMGVVGLLGYRRIELSSRVLGVLLLCEVAIVLVFDAVVAVTGGAEGPSTAFLVPSQVTSGSLGVGLMFAVASFIGFEATAVFRDEARDPARTVPRATYLALLLIGAFYTLSSWAVVTAWGDAGAVAAASADPGTMLITTITNYLGTAGGDIAQVLLMTSLLAAILSFHNVLARYFFVLGNSGALGRAGLGRACGRTHARHGSPHVGSLVQTVTAFVLLAVFAVAGMDPVTQVFAWMAGTATLGVLVLMALTCLAVLVFFRERRTWQTAGAPALGFVGLLAFLVLTVTNFPTLIGGSVGLATAIGGVLVLFFVAGAAWSRHTSLEIR